MPLRNDSRPLSSSSTMTAPSTPVASTSSLVRSASFSRPSTGLVRSASLSSLYSQASDAPPEPYYPEGSSKYALRDARISIDFSLPGTLAAGAAMPLAYSAHQNMLYFPRGNRIQYKSLIGADVGQLCKLPDTLGDLTVLAAADADSGMLALATSTGTIQLWDAGAKKLVCSWNTKGAAALAWAGPVLAVGGRRGAIRHYDTRVAPAEQTLRVTRHQAGVGTLAWSGDGRLLASGDHGGAVFIWDTRAGARVTVPLDVGEFVQRRKKMQHAGGVSALAWCPWQPKLLATGDTRGTVRLWSIDAATPHSNAAAPGTLALAGAVVGLHFATQFKELLSVVGAAPAPLPTSTSTSAATASAAGSGTGANTPNALVTHALPSLRLISRTSVPVPSSSSTSPPADAQGVAASVLAGHKVVLAVPGEGKLKVFDAWGKRREVRRQGSFLGNSIR